MTRAENSTSTPAVGYSAAVRLRLHIGGQVVPLAQIGPDRITLKEAQVLPAGRAEVVMQVDGATERWSVQVPRLTGPCRTIPAQLDPVAAQL